MSIFYQWDNNVETSIDDLIAHIDEAIIIFDENGIIVEMNPICDEILPYKGADIVGKSIDEIVRMGLVTDPIINMLLNEKKKVFKNIVYPSGTVVAFTALPIWGKANEFKGGMLVGRNISILRVLESKSNNKVIALLDEGDEYTSVSDEMTEVKSLVNRASVSDSSIFITGETGVGKEVLARYIHRNSDRDNKPFVAVNCGAIPSELIESEFFGYEEGSFTGAKKSGKAGIIEKSDGGTLFLDEIGELCYDMQKKLLRVIQENEVTRVGSSTPKKVNVRYISATNKTADEIRDPKRFRQDLYYRLSVIPIRMPSLRERRDDIIPMARYFLSFFNKKYYRNIRLSDTVEDMMRMSEWNGNVRELKNIIERLVVLSAGDLVGEDQFSILMNLDSGIFEPKRNDFVDMGEEAISINKDMTLDEAVKFLEQKMISEAVKETGSIQNAAKVLGIDPSTIHRKIKKGYLQL